MKSLNRPVVRAHSRGCHGTGAGRSAVLTAQWFGRIREGRDAAQGARPGLNRPVVRAHSRAVFFASVNPRQCLNRPVVRAHSREKASPKTQGDGRVLTAQWFGRIREF